MTKKKKKYLNKLGRNTYLFYNKIIYKVTIVHDKKTTKVKIRLLEWTNLILYLFSKYIEYKKT